HVDFLSVANRIHSKIESANGGAMATTFDIVFEGGGAKGTAFSGALEVLTLARHNYHRLVGTSAGAITAVLLGAGYSATELLAAVNETLPGTPDPVFTTFMDAPVATDFSPANINQSVTMGLMTDAHVPGFVEKSVINDLLRLE